MSNKQVNQASKISIFGWKRSN